jgi:hypothetical protein
MDKELIAMCDTPEIQDRAIRERCQTWVCTSGEGVCIAGGIDPHNCKKCDESLVWLPRLEDVLEMSVKDSGDTLVCWHYEWQSDSGLSPLKQALIDYMEEIHNKQWTGERWE